MTVEKLMDDLKDQRDFWKNRYKTTPDPEMMELARDAYRELESTLSWIEICITEDQ